MNWLDIIILTTIALFTLIGLVRGFISQVFSIVGIVAGIITGVMFYNLAGDLFIKYGLVNNKPIAGMGGFIVVTFGTYIVIQLLAWLLTKIVGTLYLTWLNRIGGGAVGVAIGVIMAFFLISGLGLFFREEETVFKNSVLTPYVRNSFSVLKETIPGDFEEKLQRAKKLIQEKGVKTATEGAVKIKEVFEEGKGRKKEQK